MYPLRWLLVIPAFHMASALSVLPFILIAETMGFSAFLSSPVCILLLGAVAGFGHFFFPSFIAPSHRRRVFICLVIYLLLIAGFILGASHLSRKDLFPPEMINHLVYGYAGVAIGFLIALYCVWKITKESEPSG
jgi:hypothetical protein